MYNLDGRSPLGPIPSKSLFSMRLCQGHKSKHSTQVLHLPRALRSLFPQKTLNRNNNMRFMLQNSSQKPLLSIPTSGAWSSSLGSATSYVV